MMKAFRGLSDGVKWRICNRVLSDGIDPEVAAVEFGLDVVVVKGWVHQSSLVCLI